MYRSAGFSSIDRRQRLTEAATAVMPVFERCAEVEHVPGLSFGVVIDAELVFAGAFGVLNIDADSKPDSSSVYRIASMTKSFTAAAILHLRDNGKLRLDDPAAIHVPELKALSYPSADGPVITVRDLLTMSAGWPQDDPWADRQLYRDDDAMSDLYR